MTVFITILGIVGWDSVLFAHYLNSTTETEHDSHNTSSIDEIMAAIQRKLWAQFFNLLGCYLLGCYLLGWSAIATIQWPYVWLNLSWLIISTIAIGRLLQKRDNI